MPLVTQQEDQTEQFLFFHHASEDKSTINPLLIGQSHLMNMSLFRSRDVTYSDVDYYRATGAQNQDHLGFRVLFGVYPHRTW